MAPTTKYGWTTPDETALVKDDASAIRTLGSSVDTTTKNLNPETTLGDISFRSSTSNVNTRLGIGTTNQVLSVVGGVPAWAAVSAGGMTLLSTTTLSGVSTTISSIDQTYTNLLIIIQNARTNAETSMQVKINGSTANQRLAGFKANNTYLTQTTFSVTNNNDNGAFVVASLIYLYASTTAPKAIQYIATDNSSNEITSLNGIINLPTTAVTSINIANANGTATYSAGTVYIYGVK
jgi:hypothetical protein